MLTYSIDDKRIADPLEDQKRANEYIVRKACSVDPGIILIKTIGSVPEGRVGPESDFDYFVLTASNSFHNISIKGKNWRTVGDGSRPLQVRWHCLRNLINQIVDLDFPIRWSTGTYFHIRVWYNLYTNHEPLYVTEQGKFFLENSGIFVNRDAVRHVLHIASLVHNSLVSQDEWEDRHYKHAKSILLSLELCCKSFDQSLRFFDAKETPSTPVSKQSYEGLYQILLNKVAENDLDCLPPQNNDLILSLYKNMTTL